MESFFQFHDFYTAVYAYLIQCKRSRSKNFLTRNIDKLSQQNCLINKYDKRRKRPSDLHGHVVERKIEDCVYDKRQTKLPRDQEVQYYPLFWRSQDMSEVNK